MDNWPRFIGTWKNADPRQLHELHEFVVRSDKTATLTFIYPDGRKQVHETRVVIIGQDPDTIRVQFHVPNGLHSYRFRFQDDNRLEYDDSRDGGRVYVTAN